MAKLEGARVRASGIRHTTTPFIWGVDNERQDLSGHNLEYVIAMVPQEGIMPILYFLIILHDISSMMIQLGKLFIMRRNYSKQHKINLLT